MHVSKAFAIIAVAASLVALGVGRAAGADGALSVGFAHADVTPQIDAQHPVWLAGYSPGRAATGVHDALFARAVVLRSGDAKIALVAVDSIGIMRPTVLEARKKLGDFTYVLVASTHDHEGPDAIGLWGPSPLQSGVDPRYLARVVGGIVQAVRAADAAAAPARALYGTAADESLVNDSRLPKVYDGVLRALRFVRADNGESLGVLVQWNCHPEAMGSRNTLVTADFPAGTIAALSKRYDCPVAYFSGAIGGLMGPPRDRVRDGNGNLLHSGDFEYARLYGQMVAALAVKALDGAGPVTLTPMHVASGVVSVPMNNVLYAVARITGVIQRDAYLWTGDYRRPGRLMPANEPPDAKKLPAIQTEVAYLRLGQLHVACIPGELYPELVYGQFQEPADPGADFPDAPLETPVMKVLFPDKAADKHPSLVFGLANDEIGYIIPKRQWDQRAPYAYGRTSGQYGEVNSIGPEAAPILMKALADRVKALDEASRP